MIGMEVEWTKRGAPLLALSQIGCPILVCVNTVKPVLQLASGYGRPRSSRPHR
jgi:hypothetical protein